MTSSEAGVPEPTDAPHAALVPPGALDAGLLAAAIAATPTGMAICDDKDVVLVANAALARFLGVVDAAELIGGSLQTHMVREDRRSFPSSNARAFKHASGDVVWGRVVRTPFDNAGIGGTHTGGAYVLVQVDDVTASRAAQVRLEYDAGHDHLTGLVNRRTLMRAVEHELGSQSGPIALLVVDVDRFKTINDALGHPEGDRLLETIASRLRSTMRLDDVVCRLGGDEFAILLRPPISESEARSSAERILALVGEPVILGDQPVATSVSIGIGFSAAGTTLESLLREADAALYKAKTEGRNRCAVFDAELRTSMEERSRLEGELRLALSAERLEIHFQPEVDLVTNEVLGVEALVRWPHPVHGVLAADVFVGLAEDAGMVADLGRWVLNGACDRLRDWGQRFDIAMRVNISALQLERSDLVGDVALALERTQVPAGMLCLEITETAVMTDVERSMDVLAQLHALGVQLAIDDFGTGFSSLAYLKRFPVGILKIDKSFVDDVASDPDGRAIVASVLGLASSLDLEVIAEGVETTTQRDVLVELGCRRAQGHLFARAMAQDETEAWLSAHSST